MKTVFLCFLEWLAALVLADDMRGSTGPREGQDLGTAAVGLMSFN